MSLLIFSDGLTLVSLYFHNHKKLITLFSKLINHTKLTKHWLADMEKEAKFCTIT